MRATTVDTSLTAIAGPPAAALTSPGVVALSGATSTNPVSLYLCGRVLTDTAPSFVGHGINVSAAGGSFTGASGVGLWKSAAGSDQILARLDTSAASNKSTSLNHVAPGLVVAMLLIDFAGASMTLRGAQASGITAQTATGVMAGTGVTRSSLRMTTATTAFEPIWLGFWEAAHDSLLSARISRWLQTRYANA